MTDDARVMQVSTEPWAGPQSHEEARCLHEGFIAGLTAYARESGHSTLRRDNDLLRRLMDEHGWKTIETYEALSQKCEHGVPDGEWCKPCNDAMKQAIAEDGTGERT